MSEVKPSDIALTQDSVYLTDAFYDALLRDRDLLAEQGQVADHAVLQDCQVLINYEARLLDDKRYDRWLNLYSPEAIYWVPQDEKADARRHANLMFDDRRRMEDRVLRLLSRHAHSLMPERRFQHLVTSVEAWEMPNDTRRVLSSQTVYEYRPGHGIDQFVFRADHTLARYDDDWKIAVKRCVLLNIDDAFEPPTLL